MLIKKIYFFVAMLFAAQLVMAQYKLSGKITDFDTQEPVKNASVYLVDLKKVPFQTKMVITLSKT